MMKNIVIIACLSVLLGCNSLESESIDPGAIFVKYYGTTKSEQLVDMERLSNGDYLILGSTNRFVSQDIVLIRVNASGSKLWEQTYNTINSDSLQLTDIPSKIRLYNDPNLGEAAFVIGTSENATNNEETKLLVLKIDISSGTAIDIMKYQYNDQRQKAIEENINGVKATYGADLIYVDEGGANDHFYLLGSTETFGAENITDPKSVLLMNILASTFGSDPKAPADQFGVQLFGFSGSDEGVSLLRDTSNINADEYYFLSTISSDLSSNVGAGGKDINIVKFDPVGINSIASSYYGTKQNDIPANFIIDGSFIYVTGTTNNGSSESAFFLTVNKALSSQKDIVLIGGLDELGAEGSRGNDLIKIKGESYLYVLGTINNYTDANNNFKQDDLMLIKVNIEGAADSGNYTIYGSNGNDAGNTILQEADGSLLIGATIDFGGSATMLSMLKTNAKGEFKK